jgi:hypothetical protein
VRGVKVIDHWAVVNLEPLSAKKIRAPLDLWLVESESEPILAYAAVFLGSFGFNCIHKSPFNEVINPIVI